MSSTDAGTKRALSDRAWGKAAILVALLLVALLVSRSCGSSAPAVTKEQAVAIAKREISYEPDGIQVRNVPRGVPQRRIWAVSLYTGTAERPDRVTVVEIDAKTGDVAAVHRGSG
ncbi:MAG: PepSY domain-containing protein [Actinomycetota bacterium]|nr:PepSY domain-containing protein [Actinomycetota bacterium]